MLKFFRRNNIQGTIYWTLTKKICGQAADVPVMHKKKDYQPISPWVSE